MTTFRYDPNNTEGAYPTAMVAEDTEIKKGNKIVATDLVDLYDCEITNPQDTEGLIFDGSDQLWKNKPIEGGGGCTLFLGYDGYKLSYIEAIYVAAGDNFSMVIASDGTLWGAGNGSRGQLGSYSFGEDPVFKQESSGSADWVKVACGGNHTLALKSNGTLWGTGSNEFGQLGLDTDDDYFEFQQINIDAYGFVECIDIACGYDHSAIVTHNEGEYNWISLYTSGKNNEGQLGLGYYNDNEPYFEHSITLYEGMRTEELPSNVRVACGYWHTAVIDASYAIQTCGRGAEGQLGNYDYSNKNTFDKIDTITDFIEVSCGAYHTMVIRGMPGTPSPEGQDPPYLDYGILWGTGRNNVGQTGTGGSGTSYFVPTDSNLYTKVACGKYHTLAISDGTLRGCGDKTSGQLGVPDNGLIDLSIYEIDSDTDWTDIAGGSYHSLALKEGFLYGTGKNDFGQLGRDTDYLPIFEFTRIHGGITEFLYNHVFIDPSNNNPDRAGQYDNPFNSLEECFNWLREECVVIPEDITITIKLLDDLDIIKKTSLNHPYGHRMIIDGDNKIISIGGGPKFASDDDNLILYNNHSMSMKNIILNYNVNSLSYIDRGKYYDINGGSEHTMAIRIDGSLWGTGGVDDYTSLENYGQLGNGEDSIWGYREYTQIGNDTDWTNVECGNMYTMAIKSSGTLWATGSNSYGQLGLGDDNNRIIFTPVGTDTDWNQVACGYDHTLAIKNDGSLWATGSNSDGQLGLGDNNNRYTFTPVGTDTDWNQVSCGYRHTLAIKNDGTLWATGNNAHGQLGLGDNNYRNTFTPVGTDTDWKDICSGGDQTLAIKTNDTLWATGNNAHGQLGLGDNNYRNTFNIIPNVVAERVYTEDRYSLYINKDDLGIFGTGENDTWQLGIADPLSRNTFTHTMGGIYVFTRGEYVALDNLTISKTSNKDIICIQIENMSSINSNNITEYSTEDLFAIKEIEPQEYPEPNYEIINYTKYSFSFIDSLGFFENMIPHNVSLDIRSTISIPDLQYNIVDWTAKNDSLITIYSNMSPTIDITRINSTLIVNDVIS